MSALDAECPRCHARPGSPCASYLDGKPLVVVHTSRLYAPRPEMVTEL